MPGKKTSKNKIILQQLYKQFGTKKVLQGVDLEIKEGESVVIIGGSGTGKSVALKCILGLIEPDEGEILVDGESVIGLNHRQHETLMHKFGMLFQGGALFDSLKVWENVAFTLLQGKNKHSKQDAREIAVERLKEVGLSPDVAERLPSELSGGMQKRVGLARAICGDPEIIFFDEPTTGLDPIMADVINELIVSCTKERGLTTLSITHDMASVRKIADRVAMLYEGKIIWHGPVKDIDKSGNKFVDQFVHGRAEGPISFGP